MKKIFVYMAMGITLGVLVAFIPLTLYTTLIAPAKESEYHGYELPVARTLEEAGVEKMQVLPLFALMLSEVCILILPALIITFIVYQIFIKRKKTL